MVRTSRTAPSVDALDNLDLDDMFAGDDVALFDGLDLDLDNMDDIAGNMASAGGNNNKASRPPPAAAAAAAAVEAEEGTTRRRKAKRKTKTPSFFLEDDDDYEEQPKKKRTTKATKKKKTTKKTQESKAPATKSKAAQNKRSSATMPPPVHRAGSVSSGGTAAVAAAGQFGGRQTKRGSAATKAKTSKADAAAKRSSAKAASPLSTLPAAAKAAASAGPTLAQIQALHSQDEFCGLLPSNTLFYPFMPAMPAEPSLKNRKVFALIDRINAAFTSHLSAGSSAAAASNKEGNGAAGISKAAETEAIFQLFQDAVKDEKPTASKEGGKGAPTTVGTSNKANVIGNSIGAMRTTISAFEKTKLAGDLYAVAALLKRQHDFLKQNAANMERWCKENFSETDHAAVYLPPNREGRRRKSIEASTSASAAAPGSVLSTFETSTLRVKLTCTGFKVPKTPALLATLPSHVTRGSDASKSARDKAAKKRKLSSPAGDTAKKVTKTPGTLVPKEAPPTYAAMHPNRRRKNVTDMMSKTGREIESRFLAQADERQAAASRHQDDLDKLVEKDTTANPHMNTTGMWKWIETSRYFGQLSPEILQERFDGFTMPNVVPSVREEQLLPRQRPTTASLDQALRPDANEADGSILDRLQSLLVEEDLEEATESEDDDADDEVYVDLVEESKLADLSDLTLDERLRLVLRSVGLSTSSSMPREPVPSIVARQKNLIPRVFGSMDEEPALQETVSIPPTSDFSDELRLVIDAMTDDLWDLNSLNNRRISFLKQSFMMIQSSSSKMKLKTEEEGLIAKCQQLLKKTKESKVKNGKAKTANNDVNALPW